MEILDGKLVSQAVKDKLKAQTEERKKQGKKLPHLAAVLIGNNGASETYVASKVKSCSEIGFTSTLIRFPQEVTEEELLFKLNELNDDFDVDGILVQLPLPSHISEQKIIETIYPTKDVDGFSSRKCRAYGARLTCFLSCHTLWNFTVVRALQD